MRDSQEIQSVRHSEIPRKHTRIGVKPAKLEPPVIPKDLADDSEGLEL